MPTPYLHKRNGTPGAAAPSSLLHGELALNYGDARVFWKDASNVIQSFSFTSIDAGEVVASGPTATLLLHFNGSQSGVDFLDSSSSNRTFTRGGNSVLRQEQKKFGSASGYFTGGTYIQTDAYAGVELGSGDFTIELWYYQLSNGTYSGLIGKGAQLSTASDVWSLEFGGAGLIFVPWVSTSSAVQCAQPSMNAWHHVAVVRNGTDLTLYVDGVSMSNTYFNATIPTNASAPLVIGAGWYQPTSRGYNGYIDELRIVKAAVYTANFTPPASEFA
jgi:hypothetical protein